MLSKTTIQILSYMLLVANGITNGTPIEELVSQTNSEPVVAQQAVAQTDTQTQSSAQSSPSSVQKTRIPKSSDKVTITKEDPHGAPSYNGMSRMQYEDAVKYTCPSQREENIFENWRPAMSHLISIGKYSKYVYGPVTDGYGYYSLNDGRRLVELSWDNYRSSGPIMESTIFRIEDKLVQFYFNWNDLSITWGKEDRAKAPASVADMADFVSKNWTEELRTLEREYKRRCPND